MTSAVPMPNLAALVDRKASAAPAAARIIVLLWDIYRDKPKEKTS